MYAKLFCFFALVGLISQTIATLRLRSRAIDSIVSDEIIISSFIGTSDETTDSDKDFYGLEVTYLEKCLKRDDLYVFDLDLTRDIKKQIEESLNHVDDSLLSIETQKELEDIFDSTIYALNNKNDSEILESINEATKNIVKIILLGKKSDLKEITKIISTLSKKLIGVRLINNGDIIESLQSMNYKIVTSVILKEDPSMFTYLRDLMQSIMNMIDHYEEQNNFTELIEALKSTLEQTNNDPRISNNTEVVQLSTKVFDKMTREIYYISGTDVVDQDKFSIARCLIEDSIMKIILRTFIIKFYPEISSYSNYNM